MTTEKKVQCPCGSDAEPTFIGSTMSNDEYASRTQYAWSHLDHYFYVVLSAPFISHGRGGTINITTEDPGFGPQRRP